MNIVILGAGPTGLGAAYQSQKLGCRSWTLYEREGHVGGLSASHVDEKGFTWDIGGHVLFSHYPYFDEVVDAAMNGAYYEHLRESWIRILNTWVPYPFQNNIRYLPETVRRECLDGLRNRTSNSPDSNDFRSWMRSVFGDGIVKYFMEPYNAKVWGVPLDTMSASWIAERISIVEPARIERNIAYGRDDVAWGPNNKFRFPRKGGTGAIFESIARPLRERIVLHRNGVRVDLVNKRIFFAGGDGTNYDVLINTSPLNQFIRSCTDVPQAVRRAADDLVHTGGLMVGLGFRGAREDPKCWMYFPESNAPFYRVTNFHNYSPANVPENDVERHFSLMCETSYSGYRHIQKGSIMDDTVIGLVKSGMIGDVERSHIVSRYLIDVPYSYPVPTRDRDAALSVIQPFLEAQGVYSRGRFGAWKYEVANMDHSFMQGVEVVERILNGRQERTVDGIVGL